MLACSSDFAAALADYCKGAFDGAAEMLEKVLAEFDDRPARTLLAAYHAPAARGNEWDGVTVLQSK